MLADALSRWLNNDNGDGVVNLLSTLNVHGGAGALSPRNAAATHARSTAAHASWPAFMAEYGTRVRAASSGVWPLPPRSASAAAAPGAAHSSSTTPAWPPSQAATCTPSCRVRPAAPAARRARAARARRPRGNARPGTFSSKEAQHALDGRAAQCAAALPRTQLARAPQAEAARARHAGAGGIRGCDRLSAARLTGCAKDPGALTPPASPCLASL